MHVESVKVRQVGTRTIRVSREFIVEVPHHIARDQKRLHEWMAGQRIRQYWEPVGTPCVVVDETRTLAHGTEAMYPLTGSERQQASR